MKCQQCGVEVAAESVFCQKCGARLPGGPAPGGKGDPSQPTQAGQPSSPGQFRRPIADVAEEILWEGGYSPKAVAGSAFALGVLTLAMFVGAIFLSGTAWWWTPLALAGALWLVLLAQLVARRISVHYKLTNQRFFHEKGVLRRVTNRVEVIDIDDVGFEQGIIDRMMGVGRIKITSSDRTDPELWIDGIENVQQVAGLLDSARRAESLRRGVTVDRV
jgi:membrane protein YdbS with pleckstrin-like domain